MKEAAKTEWKGLWNNREGVYSGEVIKKADIPNYARLIVRYNKFYDKDSNKPRFVYCFANGDAEKAITIKTEKKEYITLLDAEEKMDKIEELAEVMREGRINGDRMMLPSESQGRASSLMQRAIELIEELTGEEWEFSYITF